MTRKQFEKKYPQTKVVKGVTLYRTFDRNGYVICVSIPQD